MGLVLLRKELIITWVAGFGQVFLIGIQTYNLINNSYLLAVLTSILITVCWINGVHAVLKTRLHRFTYGFGCIVGVECAIVVHKFILK